MARQKIQAAKTARLGLKLTPEEKEYIVSQTASSPHRAISGYIMECVYNHPVVTLDTSKVLAELHKQGSNLNQIAKVANSQKYISEEFLSEIKRIAINFEEVIKAISQLTREVVKINSQEVKK